MTAYALQEVLSSQERYSREIDQLLRSVDRLEEQAVHRAIALLTEARRRIVSRLAELPGDKFEAYFLDQMRGEVDAQMGRYAREYQGFLTAESAQWWQHGVAFVNRPLSAAGAVNLITQLPALEPRFVDILTSYRASLITGITDQAIDRITMELQLGVLGGKSLFDIQRAVADILSTQRNPAGAFTGVAARAEAVTRTELNRTFNISAFSRQSQMQDRIEQIFPELEPKKKWIATKDNRTRPSHRRTDGQTVLIDQDFSIRSDDGQTYKAMYPHDARLPAHESVHCRCRSVIDISSIESILEAA